MWREVERGRGGERVIVKEGRENKAIEGKKEREGGEM